MTRATRILRELRSMRLVRCIACWSVCTVLFVSPTRAEQPAAIPSDTTPAVRDLLLARDEQDNPSVSQDDLVYFAKLPAHTRALLATAVTDEWITSGAHLREILALRLSPANFEVAMGDTCLLCHSDAESQSEDTLFSGDPVASGSNPHLDLDHFVSDVHFRRGLSCAGCHGGDPAEGMDHDFPATWPENAKQRHGDRKWVPGFCASCHSDSAFMRQFDPDLPTDQLDKYKESRHGMSLLSGENPRAAECTSCHGVHGIQGPSSPKSSVYPINVPETCGSCHSRPDVMVDAKLPDGSPIPTDQYEKYRDSVHGRALLEKGDIGAPACNDCHGNHAAMPPDIANVSQVCRTCHANNGELFDGSTHKKAFDKHGWPECGACHGAHAVEKLTDDALALRPGALCVDCHEKHARNNAECEATAGYFHAQLTGFVRAYEEIEHSVEKIARRGLDVDGIELALGSMSDSLKQSRSAIHAFDRSQFDSAAAPAREAIEEASKRFEQSKADFRFRLVGLLIAAGFILMTILALWIKLRQIESDTR
jgi:hypothetical protein